MAASVSGRWSYGLHPQMQPDGYVRDFGEGGDGGSVLYVADQDVDQLFELYHSAFPGLLYADGFESSDTWAWASQGP